MAGPQETTAKADAPMLQESVARKFEELRQTPMALNAEKSVLSSIFQDPSQFMGKAIEAGVMDLYFYLPAHRLLWQLFLERYNNGKACDLVSITQALEDKGSLNMAGGNGNLSEIYSFAITHTNFDYHLQILCDKMLLRSIIEACTSATQQAYEQDDEIPQFLDRIEQEILAVRQRTQRNDEVGMSQLVDEAFTNFEIMVRNKGKDKFSGLATGYPELDRKCNGLKAGDMFVIAARPSMGKTSFMMNVVEHLVFEEQKHVLVFSCEMPSLQLVERLLFSRSQVSKEAIKMGITPSKGQIIAFNKVCSELKKAPMYIDDTPSLSITELRAKARRCKREKGLDCIAIDYLQLMRSHSKQAQNSREREVAEISSGLKAIAKELKVPVIVLAQLNRGPEGRTGSSIGVPRMSDLRESGAIEQDADMIGLLYRQDYYADNDEKREELKGLATLVLAKNRNGATGDIPLTFESEFMRFSQRSKFEDENEGSPSI